ncbi:hypothetical protein V8E36_007704 [Tilletia maclaganii]
MSATLRIAARTATAATRQATAESSRQAVSLSGQLRHASSSSPPPPASSKPEASAAAQSQPEADQPPAKPSFFTSTSKLAEQAAAKPLPFLSTAPGYPFPPRIIANEPSPPVAAPPRTPTKTGASSKSPPPTATSSSSTTATTATPISKPSAKAAAANLRDAQIFHERKAIVAEATKGYFHDFHSLRAHGGKTWRAPTSLIREERARWWPDWVGKRLSDGRSMSTAEALRGHVSLVSVLSSKASEEHVRSFVAPTLASFASAPGFQSVSINVQLSALRALLLRIVFSSLKASVPSEAEQRGYFLCTSAPEVPARALEWELEAAKRAAATGRSGAGSSAPADSIVSSAGQDPSSSTSDNNLPGSSSSPGAEAFLRSALGLHNKHVGYVFLVDQRCRIRWAGCAFAEEAEREALRACTGVLLSRR